MRPESLTAFIVSNEPWGPQHFIKHRFAIELASRGTEVFFCDPPPPWSPAGPWRRGLDLEPIAPNLTLLRYRHPAPARLGERLAGEINDRVVGRRLRGLVAPGRTPLLWQFDPFRFAGNHLGPGSLKIYHVCDPYAGLTLDRPSAEAADLIVCTSEPYARHYDSRYPGKVIHVPHSSNTANVRTDADAGAAMRDRFGDYLFFGGSITEQVDVSLLARVAEELPATKLVIAGPVVGPHSTRDRFATLARHENVAHLGTVPASEIPALVAGSELCLSAYRFGAPTSLGPRTSILKVMDYLSQGRAIVSSSPLEYSELEGRAIYCRSDADAYVEAIGQVLAGELAVDIDAVDRFLEARTYPLAVDRILSAVDSVRSGSPVTP